MTLTDEQGSTTLITDNYGNESGLSKKYYQVTSKEIANQLINLDNPQLKGKEFQFGKLQE